MNPMVGPKIAGLRYLERNIPVIVERFIIKGDRAGMKKYLKLLSML